jgi:hypothetical protein
VAPVVHLIAPLITGPVIMPFFTPHMVAMVRYALNIKHVHGLARDNPTGDGRVRNSINDVNFPCDC